MKSWLSSVRLLISESHARARRPRNETAGFVGHVAFDHADRAALFDDAAGRAQTRVPDWFEKVDLELKRGERFAVVEVRSVGDTHRSVGDVAKDTAVQGAHWVLVSFGGLKFDDGVAGLDEDKLKPDEFGHGRLRRSAVDHGLCGVQDFCHGTYTCYPVATARGTDPAQARSLTHEVSTGSGSDRVGLHGPGWTEIPRSAALRFTLLSLSLRFD